MNEQSKIIFGAAVGAIIGAAAGYLFLTDRGRELRDRIEPAIDDAQSELSRFQSTLGRAAAMVTDGLRLAQEFSGGQWPGSRSASHLADKIQ